MKMFAQNGYGEGQKVSQGFESDYIDGVIYSPKEISPDKLNVKIIELKQKYKQKEFLFDPQYYVSLMGANPNLNIGKLEDYLIHYFAFESKGQLERESNVHSAISKTINFQNNIPLTAIISPNILISRSFDSTEGVISKHFIRLAKQVGIENKITNKIYCTIAISTEAMMNINELQEFLSTITILDNPPDGFYILVSVRSLAIANSEVFNSDVIAGWMLLNYTLSLNGFRVINGYSDLLSPLLVSVGGDGVSTGWYSNLRNFSLERFAPEKKDGGSMPIIRYLSSSLFNRIRFDELNALKDRFDSVLNKLDSDKYYEDEDIERTNEILQNWNALSNLSNTVSKGSITQNIESIKKKIDGAIKLYSHIIPFYPLDKKSSGLHLESILTGIDKFKKIAEI